MGRVGQAAVEFLASYGWAVIIVILALGALAYSGVLNPDRFLPEKCVIAGSSGLFCEDAATVQQGIVIRLRNMLKEVMIISSITTNDPQCIFSGSQNLEPDKYEDFSLVCTPGQDASLNTEFVVQYSKGASGLDRSAKGAIAKHGSFQFEADPDICQNAEGAGLCEWLDFAYGEGYQQGCCELSICCL